MYSSPDRKNLYLREEAPTAETYARLRLNLKKARILAPDRDYGSRLFRIIGSPDLPADDIVCLADPTCYISHLSALQRWGLTNRTPQALIITRPDRQSSLQILKQIMREETGSDETPPVPLRHTSHPEQVRRRKIIVYDTKTAGSQVQVRGSQARLATIGQTFLDTLQKPDYCGGMPYVLEVWHAHAQTYRNEIIEAVDAAESGLVKSRAGYILEERLGIRDPRIEQWKALGQRGSSRKLDPSAPFASTFSETWMISLNV